jgi:dTDP-4-dehydrorhamnose reductase
VVMMHNMTMHNSGEKPEVWGGIECTINRVQDCYKDQMRLNGHAERISDLDLFAGLGIRALRYPVLWERFAPNGDINGIDWSWADARLHKLRDLGVRPIVGLLHHGSGPQHTSLVDPNFAEGLGEYAGAVARRFPWVEEWTPVNEPLTTARFSGLYGHWYPHGTDEQTFARAVINQCRGVALAMRAIREVNPAAQLVQTDDLGKIYSTPKLQYQADFENERRWLSWDLLCGLVDRHHRLWWHLLWAGIEEAELKWFLDNPCPPDVLGVNYYLTSERFLDERPDGYPVACHATNGRDRYADVEAVRVRSCEIRGPRGTMEEVWNRYGRPIAITEAHLGCTREEQMRWLQEVWESAVALRDSGMDIRAVTPWAFLGSYDWDSMLTRAAGHYEPGVFDVRGGAPRPTALAAQITAMAAGETPDHPVLGTLGWWRRPKRVLYRPSVETPCEEPATRPEARVLRQEEERPLLIAGAEGPLGAAFVRLCDHRHLAHIALTQREMDITDPASVQAALRRYRPWAVINAAGYERVGRAPFEPERCAQENTAGPALLATLCAREQIQLLTFSSDLVFNGRKGEPYVESDVRSSKNVYGLSKARAETSVLEILPTALIVRNGPLFGPWEAHNFVTHALQEISAGRVFPAIDDIIISPTYIPDLVHACLDLLIDGEKGVVHLANAGAVTWAELARMAAEKAGMDTTRIEGRSLRTFDLPASLPRYSVLGSERGQFLQSLEEALNCYFLDCEVQWTEPSAGVRPRRRRVALSAG